MPTAAIWLTVPAALLAFVGLVALVIRGSVRSTTMADLAASNKELRERDADRDRIVRELTAKLDSLRDANRVLANTVTAADDIKTLTASVDALRKQLDGHHKEEMAAWAKITRLLDK